MSITDDLGNVALYCFARGAVKQWGPDQVRGAARFARSLGIDSLIVKRGEGTEQYASDKQIAAESDAAHAEGCGYTIFWYSRPDLVDPAAEAAIAKRLAPLANGLVFWDMEQEWDGEDDKALAFANALSGINGLVVCSWANPLGQRFGGVARALLGVTSAYNPMQYDDFLASEEGQIHSLGESIIIPGLDLSNEFGPNHPVQLAAQAHARGEKSIVLWEYTTALANPALVAQVVTAFKGAGGPPPPPPQTGTRPYTVQPGDWLTKIAARELGDSNRWREIYNLSRAVIVAWAQRDGQKTDGSFIVPGEVLTLPVE